MILYGNRRNLLAHTWYASIELDERFREKAFREKMKRATVVKCLVEAWVDGKIDVTGAYRKKRAELALNLERNKKNGRRY